ncbi:MAG: fibronectin type III domain-containing protein [Flavobacteriales bacterium]|nr:fibronectin type III domain-containing protein [Flavobacteriales bacterium]
MMIGNPAFLAPNPLPNPSLEDFDTALDKLDTANQAYAFNRGKVEKDARDLAFSEMKEMFHNMGGYVQLASGGKKEVIISAGLDVQKSPTPVGIPSVPGDVRAASTKVHGQIIARWKASKGHRFYKLFRTEGDPSLETGWVLVAETGKNRFVDNGLERFKTYSYRVVAIGTIGNSIPSDAASATAA